MRQGTLTMALLSAVRGATWRCSGRLLTRHFSQAARCGQRPGGEELRRLLLDDLPPTPRSAGELEVLFGLSPCLLALRAARRRVARLLLQAGRSGLQGERAELLRVAEARDIPVLRLSRQKLDALCRYHVHQGVCMEVSPLQPRSWAEVGEAKPGDDSQQLWLVLEGLQDPRNLGAVLRSAHFLGVDKIITSRRNSCPLTPIVSKASAGAMEVMDVFSTDDLAAFLQAKAQQGWLVAGTVGCPEPEIAPSSEIPITSCLDFLWEQPTLLVLGNEGSGLSREVQASCRLLLTILPGRQLPPGLESLNVSVAAGILLHTICSQRKSSLAEAKREQLPQDPKNPQPHQKGSEWLSTQDCPKDQKKRGRRGTDLDCLSPAQKSRGSLDIRRKLHGPVQTACVSRTSGFLQNDNNRCLEPGGCSVNHSDHS
ncbi:rRNA methyltransferase 1, mitochondrial isoform X3 [Manis javanica]|uniref:rRNA methyltransferase 1, mitochondrial isoform X3 n=1 Tax=Manis javanica TaxID=9974 RepID=UPI00187A665E|nr:rRNA methyltransferase 1, mitochondrial isoform X4 [Manis javanica]